MTGNKIGVPISGGTDAHRVSTYNPVTVPQWFLDGKTAGGTALREAEETPNQIGGIESVLTMVGGEIGYAAGPYRQMDTHVAAQRGF